MKPRATGFAFDVLAQDGHARKGRLVTPHAIVETPTFMPVGTQGSVKTLTPEEVASTGARIVLGNTYHLWLRPGPEAIRDLGGLRGFTRWPHAMLTDSGGFQAFSLGLAKGTKAALVSPSEEGFTFRSHLDGSKHHLSPEEAVRVQALIGADIQMQLDICPPGESPRAVVEAAVAQTTRWAKRALASPRGLRALAVSLERAGRALFSTGDFLAAEERLREAVELRIQTNDLARAGTSLLELARTVRDQGRVTEHRKRRQGEALELPHSIRHNKRGRRFRLQC